MRAHELRVGRTYAYPASPGPWYRVAVPARVMSRGRRERILVLLPDGLPSIASRPEYPRASLVWIDAEALVSSWDEWPAHAASARADLSAVVASAVAAIGGRDAPTLTDPSDRRTQRRWWSRPIHELLRPPALAMPTPSGDRPGR